MEKLLKGNHSYKDKIIDCDKVHQTDVAVIEQFEEQSNKMIIDAALMRMKELYSITDEEMEVFRLVVDGFTNREISQRLAINELMVRKHILNVFRKINVNDRILAIAKVYQAYIEEKIALLSRRSKEINTDLIQHYEAR